MLLREYFIKHSNCFRSLSNHTLPNSLRNYNTRLKLQLIFSSAKTYSEQYGGAYRTRVAKTVFRSHKNDRTDPNGLCAALLVCQEKIERVRNSYAAKFYKPRNFIEQCNFFFVHLFHPKISSSPNPSKGLWKIPWNSLSSSSNLKPRSSNDQPIKNRNYIFFKQDVHHHFIVEYLRG